MPAISVVIPTYNRVEQLRGALVGLAGQTGLAEPPEVVVVSDGSSDGTDEFLRSPQCPLPVVAVRQDNAGPAAARNRGIQEATGELVVFIDDDVVPAPDLLAAHLRHHEASGNDDTVVIGPMITPADEVLSPWVRWEQDMLYKQYAAMERGDWEATARQFYTANASIARRHLVDAGGFDEAFRRAEDVELAYRLADRGLHFTFAKDAIVDHHAERSFASWLDIARTYGRNDVIFGRDLDQRWLLDSIATEFHGRHRLVRALTRTCATRPRLRRVAIGTLKGTARAASALHLAPVAKQSLERAVQPRLLRRDGRRARFRPAHADDVRGPARRAGAAAARRLRARADARAHHPLQQPAAPHRRRRVDRGRVRADRLRRRGLGGARARVRQLDGARRHPRPAGDPPPAQRRARSTPCSSTPRCRRSSRPTASSDVPTVVSLDATPIQYDELGAHYGHDTGGRAVER